MIWGGFNVRGLFRCGFCGAYNFGRLCRSICRAVKTAAEGKYEYYVLIPSKHCGKNVSAAVYAARMKMNLIGDEDYGKVIVLDTGMTEKEKLGCQNICRETNGIYLFTAEDLEEYLK